ncbi:hypothetical protein EDC01DRAFT_635856 [Geopyxis carbonaria]|nr:hypothetical protein EDC01DRAFT_635856 [Geopyxis carbonaria]
MSFSIILSDIHFGENFHLYDHIDKHELRSALGSMVVERLRAFDATWTSDDLMPSTLCRDALLAIIAAEAREGSGGLTEVDLPFLDVVTRCSCTFEGCEEVFNTAYELCRHMGTHATREARCPLCPSGNNVWTTLEKFLEYHLFISIDAFTD